MLFIIVGAQFFCGMSSITSASRMMYAFSRDRAVPGHQLWRRLNARARAVHGRRSRSRCSRSSARSRRTSARTALVAYAAVTSIATIGLYIAYAIPIFLRLRAWATAWEPGEWNLGKHYKWIGIVACLWVVLHLDPVHGAAQSRPGSRGTTTSRGCRSTTRRSPCSARSLLVGVWWLLSASKWFKGPISQGTPEELARIEAQYEHGAPPARRRPRRRIDSDTGSEGAGARRLPPRRRATQC